MESRRISVDVMVEAKLGIDIENSELAIPVYSPEGELLFYKYRRSPWRDNGPKYRYDKGATAALYGAELLKNLADHEEVVITEGELDALALRSLGMNAVSTTGGSGTWKEEWAELLARFKVVIAYDADGAGAEGAIRVAGMMPEARVAWLPVYYGKDPTEILAGVGGEEALKESLADAKKYVFPRTGTEDRVKKLLATAKKLRAERMAVMKDPIGSPLQIDAALAWIDREIQGERDMERRMQRPARDPNMQSEIERAKAHPIVKILKVNRDGFASCPFHTEKTASFKVYKDNHAYCFGGCGKRYDVLDIYMQIHGCDLKTAIKELS